MNKNKNFLAAILIVIAAIFTVPTKAQVTIGAQKVPENFSVLELISNSNRGLRLPQLSDDDIAALMETAEFKAEANGLARGLTVFNTSTKCVNVWNGEIWIKWCADAEAPCDAPATPDAMTLSPASPIINLTGTFTATVPNVDGMTYTWSLPQGLTGSSTTNSITITGATTGSYDASAIAVTATNSCGATSAATAGSGTICVGVALRNDIPPSVTFGSYTWSTKNVDAPGTFTTNAWDLGMLYQWNVKVGWSTSEPRTSSPAGKTWLGPSLASSWDMTNNNPCPTGWRVPTNTALAALKNTASVWIDACAAVNIGFGPVPGQIFGTNAIPANSAAFKPSSMLFLPAAGNRIGATGALNSVGKYGYYWSSINPLVQAGYGIRINNDGIEEGNFDNSQGFSVRCVAN